jgi:hypothetical protein
MSRPLDPSGILARVPELEALSTDPGIHKAIERGSPRGVYRALFWARWLGRLRDEKSKKEASALLGNRRLFLEPLAGRAPVMSTINGIGTTIYGREEQGDDGAYVTTLFFVFFFVPIIPIGAYLVADAGGRSYRFYGKAPLGSVSYLWGLSLLLAASCAALFGMASTLWASQHATVYVFDGLPVPVVATIGGQTVQIAPDSHAAIVVGSGTQQVAITTLDGRPVEAGSIEARAGEDVLAWNVLGAAPLYLEQVVYGSSLYQPPTGPDPELACGRTDIHWGSVDYAFREPPSSIQMQSQYGTETHSHADVAPGGFRLCAALLASRRQYAEAVSLLTHVASAMPPTDTMAVLELADYVLRVGGQYEDTLPMLTSARMAMPNDVTVHRAYQDAMVAIGRRDEVRSEYEARATADPTSGDAAYLAVRLETHPGELDTYASLVQRFPDHGLLLRAYGYTLYDQHRCLEATEVWSRPAALVEGESMTLPRAACLISLGRAAEAAQLVDETTQRMPQAAETFAPAYVAAAMAGGASDPRLVLSRADFSDDPGARMRATLQAGLPVDRTQLSSLDGPDRDLTEIFFVAALDPDRALALALTLPRTSIRQLPEPLFVLLYGEACRRDAQSPVAIALAAGSPLGPNRTDLLRTFVATGTENTEITELYPDVRAGAWVVRARATTNEEERVRLLARVPRDDVFGAWATRAMSGWPPAEPSST